MVLLQLLLTTVVMVVEDLVVLQAVHQVAVHMVVEVQEQIVLTPFLVKAVTVL
jgi:hypothetical protein